MLVLIHKKLNNKKLRPINKAARGTAVPSVQPVLNVIRVL